VEELILEIIGKHSKN